jgi:Radical SAM N-terminal
MSVALESPPSQETQEPARSSTSTLKFERAAAPSMPVVEKRLNEYRPYWAKRFGKSKFLPMSRDEMTALGWDECDIIIVVGDAYSKRKASEWASLPSLIGKALSRLKCWVNPSYFLVCRLAIWTA